jgi:hypothetical protein
MLDKKHKGCTRCYIRTSKSYYAKSLPKENLRVIVGMYDLDGGGTSGEFEFEWVLMNNKGIAKLNAFEDSWSSLWQFKDLLEKMNEIDNQEIQEPEFCKLLDSLGILDNTEYLKK